MQNSKKYFSVVCLSNGHQHNHVMQPGRVFGKDYQWSKTGPWEGLASFPGLPIVQFVEVRPVQVN